MRKKYERASHTRAFLANYDPKANIHPVTRLLPYSDMVIIMQKLLEFQLNKVHEIATNDEAPSFIHACAKMLDDDRLVEYMDAFRICQEMYEKEQRKKQTDM